LFAIAALICFKKLLIAIVGEIAIRYHLRLQGIWASGPWAVYSGGGPPQLARPVATNAICIGRPKCAQLSDIPSVISAAVLHCPAVLHQFADNRARDLGLDLVSSVSWIR